MKKQSHTTEPRILIADDHELVRAGLHRVLAGHFARAIFGEAGTMTEALDLVREQSWDVLITDITMPGRSGLDLVKEARAVRPRLPILVLSVHAEEQFAVRAFKAGAAGYITKNCVAAELIAAVTKLLAGGKYVTASLAERLASSLRGGIVADPHKQLSDREFEVFRHLASGKAVKGIAGELHLSVNTVSTYRQRVLEKLKLRTNADLTRYALNHQLI